MAGTMQGKVALVTGGGSGLGRATALVFAREGAKVVVDDIVDAGGKETVRMIKKAKGEATYVHADVSKPAEVESLVKQTVETYGRLDCAYNNAGIMGLKGKGIIDYPEEEWNRVVAVDLTGVWFCMKYEIPQMLKQGGGAIVNTSSTMGLRGGSVAFSDNPPYVAAKHGVIGLSQQAALEFARKGIRINAICPGWMDTPLVSPPNEAAARDQAKEVEKVEPMGRRGMPIEIGEAVVWLCSDAASFVTGHVMCVDGGWTAY